MELLSVAKGNHDRQQGNDHANADYLGIGGKQLEHKTAQEHQQHADGNRAEEIHPQTDLDALLHAAKFPCAVVLTYKCGDRNTKGAADHPVQRVDLAEGRPRSDRLCTKGIQRTLNDDVGDAVHGGLQTGRQSDFKNQPHRLGVNADLVQMQLEHIGGAAEGNGNQHRADALRKGSCNGRTGDAHVEKYNQ